LSNDSPLRHKGRESTIAQTNGSSFKSASNIAQANGSPSKLESTIAQLKGSSLKRKGSESTLAQSDLPRKQPRIDDKPGSPVGPLASTKPEDKGVPVTVPGLGSSVPYIILSVARVQSTQETIKAIESKLVYRSYKYKSVRAYNEGYLIIFESSEAGKIQAKTSYNWYNGEALLGEVMKMELFNCK
jgi:hypothetical protein